MMVRRLAWGSLLAACAACAAAAQSPGSAQNPSGEAPQLPAQTPQATPPAEPQGEPESAPQTVVVTARKWEELLQDVPQSATVVTEQRLRDAGIDTIRAASFYSPNTLLTEFTATRLSFPFVRGIGSGQGEPSVATFLDGVPQLTVSSTNLPLVGVERVEFLRGPLSALYGRNTLGGAIHVITKPPGKHASADAAASFGNFDAQDYRLSLSAPLVDDRLAFSVDGMFAQRDGYTINDVTGNDVDFRETWFGRGQLLWTPDDRNEVRFAVHGEQYDNGGFALFDLQSLRARPHHIAEDFEGHQDRDLVAGSVTWNRYGDDVDLTSITGIEDWSIDESADFDFTSVDAVRRFTDESQTYVTQELRLASPEDGGLELSSDARLLWLTGVSGFYSDAEESAANEFRPGGAGIFFPPSMVGTDRATGDLESYGVGVFGQLTLELVERWELAAAIRWDYESKDADIDRVFETGGFTVPVAATDDRASFDEVSPRFSVSYHWNEDVMSYALAARGFKAGGFNLTAPAGQESFGPETSWTYELGTKSSWLEDRLTANAAVFWIEWDDMQLSQFDATSGGYVTNAGEARSAGVELELAARPVKGLELFAGGGWLDTEFESFVDQFGQSVAGNELPFAPDTTANAGAQYTHEITPCLSLFGRGEYVHVGEFFYDAGNRGSERYGLANFRAGGGGPHWRIEGWVLNAFDEDYVMVAFQPNPADPTQFVGESAAPRTYGVTLRATF